jgi:hypothetical protein
MLPRRCSSVACDASTQDATFKISFFYSFYVHSLQSILCEHFILLYSTETFPHQGPAGEGRTRFFGAAVAGCVGTWSRSEEPYIYEPP